MGAAEDAKEWSDAIVDLRTALAAVEMLIANDTEIDNALIESDEAGSAIADTNAVGYCIDDIEVVSAQFVGARLAVKINWTAEGEQNPDAMFAGNEIFGTAEVMLGDEPMTVERITVENKDYSE